jgi:hypothetical protein
LGGCFFEARRDKNGTADVTNQNKQNYKANATAPRRFVSVLTRSAGYQVEILVPLCDPRRAIDH